MEAVARCVLLLKLIPTWPRQVTAEQLHAEFHERGHHLTLRSVQRMLAGLATVFPLERNDLGKPFGWRWARSIDPVNFMGAVDARTRTDASDGAPVFPGSACSCCRVTGIG